MLLSAQEVSASTESEEAFNKKEIRKTYSDNIYAEQSQYREIPVNYEKNHAHGDHK